MTVDKREWFRTVKEVYEEPPTAWFVDKLIPYGGVSLVFGPPNAGKSLLALDLSVRVATGRAWGGRDVLFSSVLYIATEGAISAIKERLMAWGEVHGDPGALANVLFYVRDINITDPEYGLGAIVRDASAKLGEPPGFIVVDTLNYASTADENSNREMGDVMKKALAVRDEFEDYNPTILFVHHTPKADWGTARGASAIEGAIDSSLQVIENPDVAKLIDVTNKKNRYSKKGSHWAFRIVDDEDDGLAAGATLKYADASEIADLGKSQHDAAKEAILEHLTGPTKDKLLKESMRSLGFSEATYERAKRELKDESKIMKQTSNKQSPWVRVSSEWTQ